MVSILKRLHLISVLFCYFLFFLVLNSTQLSQAYFISAGRGAAQGDVGRRNIRLLVLCPTEGHKDTTGNL
jgi:hypothetical protein